MYHVSLKFRTTCGSLGEQEMLREHEQTLRRRQVFFAGHIPQVTITGHSIFAQKQHKNNLNSANRTRLEVYLQ